MTLAPSLGKLADPPGKGRFESIRIALINQLISTPGRPLPQEEWEAALQLAVTRMVEQIAAEATSSLQAARGWSRLPMRRLTPLLPSATWKTAAVQRLLSAAVPLEQLANLTPDLQDPDQLRGSILAGVWDEILLLAEAEVGGWQRTALWVRNWHRPVAPLWIISFLVLGTVILAAAWIGGLLTPPRWFAPVVEWYWS